MQPLRCQVLGLIAGLFSVTGCQSVEVPEPVTESKAALTDDDFIVYAIRPSDTDGTKTCNPLQPGAIGCTADAPDAKHVLYLNKLHKEDGRLLVYLPGTNVDPGWDDDQDKCKAARCDLYRVAADRGYHVLALSYFTASSGSFQNVDGRCHNEVAFPDPQQRLACFGQYMNEVLDGTPNCSDAVCGAQLTISQHPQDSILQRLKSVLTFAAATQYGHGWGRYLNENGSVKWGQVTIAGSSLGSSYAAMIAQQNSNVHRAVLLAGPNDGESMGLYGWQVAPWLESYCTSVPSCPPFMYCPDTCLPDTPPFLGLVHEKNKMESETAPSRLFETLEAWRALGMSPVIHFDPEPGVSPNFQGAQVLISTDPETTAEEAHRSVTQDEYADCPQGEDCPIGYEAAWRYLVGSGL